MNNQVKHELKILPEYFQAVWNGTKTFEVRKNDRNYAVGDTLVLKEWKPEDGYTGSGLVRRVSYMLDDSEYVKEGFVILGLVDSVPNIKPGDKVWIIDSADSSFFGKEGIVESISNTDILRARLKGVVGDWPLTSLEVVE
ncbi:hypothetical protein JCM10914A_56000 [Paenibacillus sp. JCM 10914]|uniref:ASCH/PUA domain-containing protein n=1 Tax=Paenibacillus sp. JCM 10914 TaxID=1236974 RepID=UPI0003CCB79E|nr:hypothetical protein JCM10914_5969 [Paenibacillus sp. JCM 10914]